MDFLKGEKKVVEFHLGVFLSYKKGQTQLILILYDMIPFSHFPFYKGYLGGYLYLFTYM